MPTTHVKGRVLFENFIPVGHASVEVFDNDTDITLSGLVHTTDDGRFAAT